MVSVLSAGNRNGLLMPNSATDQGESAVCIVMFSQSSMADSSPVFNSQNMTAAPRSTLEAMLDVDVHDCYHMLCQNLYCQPQCVRPAVCTSQDHDRPELLLIDSQALRIAALQGHGPVACKDLPPRGADPTLDWNPGKLAAPFTEEKKVLTISSWPGFKNTCSAIGEQSTSFCTRCSMGNSHSHIATFTECGNE